MSIAKPIDALVVFLLLPFSPVRAAVAWQIAGQIAGASRIQVTGQIAATVAKTGLVASCQSASRVTAMGHPAAVKAHSQDEKAAPQAEAVDGSIAKF